MKMGNPEEEIILYDDKNKYDSVIEKYEVYCEGV